jgi:hypothetical protein
MMARTLRPSLLSVAAAFAWLIATAPAHAQWPRIVSPRLPRTADGKVNLTAPTPRAADGHPDLSGVWEMYSESDNPKLLINLASDQKPGDVVFLPDAEALYKERLASNGKDHPGAQCLPSGIPEKDVVPAPYKIVQTPDLIVFLYESRTIFRQVFTDGRPLPRDPNPAWQGYSVGKWDGDTLVVDSAGFNGKNWLDMAGHPSSDALHVTERFTRRDIGRMDLQITINDPKAYAKPWTIAAQVHLLPQDDVSESICEENNKAPVHMVGR